MDILSLSSAGLHNSLLVRALFKMHGHVHSSQIERNHNFVGNIPVVRYSADAENVDLL